MMKDDESEIEEHDCFDHVVEDTVYVEEDEGTQTYPCFECLICGRDLTQEMHDFYFEPEFNDEREH